MRVAPAIVALNVLVFVAMVATGVGLISPEADAVLAWGADFGPRTLNGEPWRVLSNVFIHFGLVHLAFNMLALWNAGALVERLYGPLRFAALYLAAGVTGSVASLAIHPQVVSAGASGAVFGVYGALAAFLVRQRGVIPMPVLTQLRTAAVSFIAYNIVFGLSIKGIDNAAHMGGLLGGAVAGLLLARPLVPGRPHAPLVPVAVVLGACGLAWLALTLLPRPLDLKQAFADFSAMEQSTSAKYDRLAEEVTAGKLPPEQFAAAVEREVVGPWRQTRARFATAQGWSAGQKRLVDLLVRYADERGGSYAEFAAAARAHDEAAAGRARERSERANRIVEELNALKLD